MGCGFDQSNYFLPSYFCFYPSFKSKSLWNCEIKTVNLLHNDSYLKKILSKDFLESEKIVECDIYDKTYPKIHSLSNFTTQMQCEIC